MRQLTLFARPSVNVVARMKTAMRVTLGESGLSRDQVADRMTELAHQDGVRIRGNSARINKALLDKWLSEGAPHVIPLPLLPVFCAVVGNALPLQELAGPLGYRVITAEDARLLAWAEAEKDRRAAVRRARKAAEEVGL